LKDYLTFWASELLKRKSSTLKAAIDVTGDRDRHLGPKLEFARIRVRAEPSATFEVVNNVVSDDELRKFGYLDWAIFGLLDVLMLAEPRPLHELRIILEDAQYSRIDSSQMAFLHAGRDAGRKIIDAFKGSRS
jgi:hypothetical protein